MSAEWRDRPSFDEVADAVAKELGLPADRVKLVVFASGGNLCAIYEQGEAARERLVRVVRGEDGALVVDEDLGDTDLLDRLK